MKNEVLYLLLNNYADHEPVFLASAIACDERRIKESQIHKQSSSSHIGCRALMQWFPHLTRLFFWNNAR